MIRQLLVPVDLTEASSRALRLAVRLARSTGAHLTVLSVGALPDSPPSPSPALHEPPVLHILEMHEAQAEHQELLAFIRAEVPDDVACRAVKRVGEPTKEVLAEAASHPYDLIVIARHVHSGLHRALLGSVSEALIDTAPVPVVVTR